MLQKLNKIEYSNLINIASTHDCGCVYPLSAAEGIQEGDNNSCSLWRGTI